MGGRGAAVEYCSHVIETDLKAYFTALTTSFHLTLGGKLHLWKGFDLFLGPESLHSNGKKQNK